MPVAIMVVSTSPSSRQAQPPRGSALMDRRAFFGALGLLAAPLAVEAQQAGQVSHIGYLTLAGRGPLEQVFEEALRERGWVTGENIVITYRHAEGKYDRLPALAAELVRLEPRVIVAAPTEAVRAAKNATSAVPS